MYGSIDWNTTFWNICGYQLGGCGSNCGRIIIGDLLWNIICNFAYALFAQHP